jgi:hypothetical protein
MRRIQVTRAANPCRKGSLRCHRPPRAPQTGGVQSIQFECIAEADTLSDLQGFVFLHRVVINPVGEDFARRPPAILGTKPEHLWLRMGVRTVQKLRRRSQGKHFLEQVWQHRAQKRHRQREIHIDIWIKAGEKRRLAEVGIAHMQQDDWHSRIPRIGKDRSKQGGISRDRCTVEKDCEVANRPSVGQAVRDMEDNDTIIGRLGENRRKLLTELSWKLAMIEWQCRRAAG